MKIGIVPNLDGKTGGVYQYCLIMLDALVDIQKKIKDLSVAIFANDLDNPVLERYKKKGWVITSLYPSASFSILQKSLIKNKLINSIFSLMQNAVYTSKGPNLNKHLQYNKINKDMRNWFLRHEVDLMIYPTSNVLSFETMIPYIFTIHDLNHRIYHEFPEVSAPAEWKAREYSFRNGIKNSLFVLVDSQIGKEDVLRFYPECVETKKKIKVLPFLPASYLETKISEKKIKEVREKYKFPQKYLFYPARFWPHKNHLRIIKALGLLKKKYSLNIPLVLCGSYSGAIREYTFKDVMVTASKLGIKENIYYIGYAEDDDMSVLYHEAHALVMPTFFGPTNIPVIEAWEFDCPVITSNIRGIREQAGKAALLVNPRSVESIAETIRKLWIDKELRKYLVEEGKKRLAIYDKGDYNKRLRDIIKEAKEKVNKDYIEQ